MDQVRMISKTTFNDWIRRIHMRFRIVGPQEKKGQYIFDEMETAVDLALDYPTTCMPPKKYLFPQKEKLISYYLDGSHVEAVLESEPTVILGIHSCDMQAARLFDQIFSQGFADHHYKKRREDIYLISIECFSPCSEHAYCRDMGTWHLPQIADLHLTDLGEHYLVHVNTEKGETLIAEQPLLELTPAVQAQYDNVMAEKEIVFTNRLNFKTEELHGLLRKGYHSTLWQDIGDDCLVCGMCTQVCPTCVCFDVMDEADLTQTVGQRIRRWDSCQATTFALVAGGHNFREARMARQRHRFMRKGKYMNDAFGMLGCVGCGRCGETCLVHITPIKVLNALHKEQQISVELEGEPL